MDNGSRQDFEAAFAVIAQAENLGSNLLGIQMREAGALLGVAGFDKALGIACVLAALDGLIEMKWLTEGLSKKRQGELQPGYLTCTLPLSRKIEKLLKVMGTDQEQSHIARTDYIHGRNAHAHDAGLFCGYLRKGRGARKVTWCEAAKPDPFYAHGTTSSLVETIWYNVLVELDQFFSRTTVDEKLAKLSDAVSSLPEPRGDEVQKVWQWEKWVEGQNVEHVGPQWRKLWSVIGVV